MANRRWIPTTEKLDLLKVAGCTHIEAHDTDILDLVIGERGAKGYPVNMSEKEKMELLEQAAIQFRKELDKRHLECGMFTMNLFSSEPDWNYGNFGSEIDKTRDLAISRTVIGIRIASQILHAVVYVYWVGTNGWNSRFAAYHPNRIERTRAGIQEVLQQSVDELGDEMLPFAVEPKDEEPFYKMYLGSASWALECCWRIALEDPQAARFLGLNIETCHSRLGKADSAADYGIALEAGKLFHTHENGGLGAGFDEDRAAGDDSMLELVERMWHLHTGGYSGLFGIDVQPLPTDDDDQAAASVARSIKCLKWGVDKARLLDNATMFQLQAEHNEAGILDYVNHVVFGI